MKKFNGDIAVELSATSLTTVSRPAPQVTPPPPPPRNVPPSPPPPTNIPDRGSNLNIKA
ncbi:MAG: hypothetical protein K2Q32_08690 [Alphaproteobacteria bacterium]|nr:hypothetical protein [Alphaproteobacteria bacterium]